MKSALDPSANDERYLTEAPDPPANALAKPVAVPPDTVWNCNGRGTDLFGSIIERCQWAWWAPAKRSMW